MALLTLNQSQLQEFINTQSRELEHLGGWRAFRVPDARIDTGTTHHFQRKANSLEDLIEAIDAEEDTALELNDQAWEDLRDSATVWYQLQEAAI